MGRVTQVTFPSSFLESYSYDANGNMLSKKDRNGNTISYAYDFLNRLTQKTYPDSTIVNYTYDLADRLTQVSDASGQYSLSYDNMDRLAQASTTYSAIAGKTFTVAYGYDAASNITFMTDPQSGQTSYVYDADNRTTSIKDPSRNAFTLVYDALSRRTQLTRPNGLATNYQYDTLSRLDSILHQITTRTGTTTLDGAIYQYDAVGNRISRADQRTQTTLSYAYDPLYELTTVSQGATSTEKYTYDPVGNRLSSLAMASYTYNNSNELTADTSATFTYDNNGNMLSKTDSTGTTSFAWDFENRLKSVTLAAGAGTVSFIYDPFGRRIQKASSAAITNYLYDGSDLLEEVSSNGTVLARYTQGTGIDAPLAETRSGTTSFYEADGLGSVTSLSNSSGALVNTYSYDSFGNSSGTTGTVANSFRFTGREYDSETGLYYYRARYYDSSIGHFISEDPLQLEAGDVNFYAYVWNNPVNLVDPRGLRPGDQYPNLRCAGWHAILDINSTSRHRSQAWPNGREYGGWMYRNPNGTYSYTAPVAGGAAGVQINQFNPIPAGATAAGDYHTHGAYDPAFNGQGINPGQPGYNWHNDGNEVFSPADMATNEAEGPNGLPGFLGTPQGTTEEYIPIPGHPGAGHANVLTQQNCGCQQQHH